MIVKRLQKERNLASRDLARARRLYARLVRHYIINNPSSIKSISERAQSFGLYSEKTAIKDIGFSLVRYAYKFDCQGMDWYSFCDHFNLWKAWYR